MSDDMNQVVDPAEQATQALPPQPAKWERGTNKGEPLRGSPERTYMAGMYRAVADVTDSGYRVWELTRCYSRASEYAHTEMQTWMELRQMAHDKPWAVAQVEHHLRAQFFQGYKDAYNLMAPRIDMYQMREANSADELRHIPAAWLIDPELRQPGESIDAAAIRQVVAPGFLDSFEVTEG